MIRDTVKHLATLGPLPVEDTATFEQIDRWQTTLEAVSPPVSDEEAILLCTLFGPDTCFGMAWSLLHLIETAPSWPIKECLVNQDNYWIRLLAERLANYERPSVGA